MREENTAAVMSVVEGATERSGPTRRTDREIETVLYARRKALADLMHSQALGQGDVRRAIHQITETAAEVLDVERASVWQLCDGGTAIECTDLFERTPARHSAGIRIHAREVPRYFAALEHERAIRADDARTDERTSEFRDGYLEPLGITSMLDAPIFVRGKMVGVVCHEHVGSPRRWTFPEELLVGTFADFVALVFETAAWHQAERALRVERDALESKVVERTRDLQDSEASLRTLLERSPVSMVLTRISDHTVAFANRRAAEMFEIPLEETVGTKAPDHWVVPAERTLFLAGLQRDGRVDDLEVQLRARSGRLFWARVSAQRVRFGGEDTLMSAMVDITEQKQAQERLRDLAIHDALTGLYTRRHIEEIVRRELERALRYARPLTIAILDVDHFKRVNDTHGHPVGDEVLRAISERCRRTLRTNDVLGRYGGEEFLVVFPETNLEDARVVAERLRGAIAERPIRVGERALEMTISSGLCALEPGQDFEALFKRADAALYAAKHGGRNQVRAAGET
jgi:diguanylate cyclase (GGDEF)-like protein/PAS domain S-box-containing protein